MKTPYDPAVRIGKRTLESIRISLRAEMIHIAALDDQTTYVAAQKARECETAEGDWTVSTYDWLRARQAQIQNIAQDKAQAEAALGRLQKEAAQAYGQLQSTQSAATLWTQHARQRHQRKAQAEADDLTNMRLLLRRRRAAKQAAMRYG